MSNSLIFMFGVFVSVIFMGAVVVYFRIHFESLSKRQQDFQAKVNDFIFVEPEMKPVRIKNHNLRQ